MSLTLLQYSHSKLPEGVINTGVAITHAHVMSFTLLQYSHSKLPEGVINPLPFFGGVAGDETNTTPESTLLTIFSISFRFVPFRFVLFRVLSLARSWRLNYYPARMREQSKGLCDRSWCLYIIYKSALFLEPNFYLPKYSTQISNLMASGTA